MLVKNIIMSKFVKEGISGPEIIIGIPETIL